FLELLDRDTQRTQPTGQSAECALCARSDECALEHRSAVEGGRDDARAFEDERGLVSPRSRVTNELPQPPDAVVPGAERRHGGSGCLERLASGRHERAERGRIVDGEIGEDLAVDLDAGRPQPGDKTRVRDVVLTAGRVDADDPKPAELTF